MLSYLSKRLLLALVTLVLVSFIVFLASDAASNLSGAILPVDNGWSAV